MKTSPVVVVGLTLTLGCLLLYIVGPGFIQAISNYAYDEFLKRVHEPPQSGRVVIVDLDDASLERFGQWPWSRYLVAEMTQKILDAGASVVGFDIVFAEKDRTSPAIIQEAVNKYFNLDVHINGVPENIADFDKLFANVIKDKKVILGGSMHPVDSPVDFVDHAIDPTYKSCFSLKVLDGRENVERDLMQADGITMAIPTLSKVANTAFFNAVMDSDSIVRSNPLIWAMGTRIYPSLAIEAVRMDKGVSQGIIEFNEDGIRSIRFKDLKIPVDNIGRLIINYRSIKKDAKTGFVSSFPTYSAEKILMGEVDDSFLKDKIVFIGASAVGLKDVKASPLTQHLSGVEVHATIVDNILAGDILWIPTLMDGVHSMVIVFMGLFLTAFIARGKSWLSFLVSIAIILLSIKLSIIFLSRYHLVFVPTWVILSVIIIYPILTMIKYWQEELQKRKVRDMFGTMVSKDVLQYLENNPKSFSLTGQRAEATMFFSDVAGFTTISENLEPDKLSELLNRYLTPMTDIIMSHRGYVDKYEGDLIMAEWGVPFPSEDHPVQACLAAIEQQEKLAELRPLLKEEFGHELYVRMGINSGIVTAGNMGSDKRFQYTVMGDAVNQAARFEPINRDYGTSIIIGETTYLAAKDAIEVRFLDKIVVKGKTLPICIYELIGRKGAISAEKIKILEFYNEALNFHLERKWDDAIKCFDEALKLDINDGPSFNMRGRVLLYKINPPPDVWNGEYIKTTKN